MVIPTTTSEQDRSSLGHRNINLMWETTQMRIAMAVVAGFMMAQLFVVLATTTAILYGLVTEKLSDTVLAVLVGILAGALSSLGSTMTLVIGFYFGRVNHTKDSGASEKGR